MSTFGYVRVAAVIPELEIGNVEFNTEVIIKQIRIAKQNKSDLVVFPELNITGYSCADLFFQILLIEKAKIALNKIAKETENCTVIVGLPILHDGKLFNCAAVLNNNSIIGYVPKTYLPNRNEFYESRWFTPAEYITENDQIRKDFIFQNNSTKIGIEICEDVWAPIPPSSYLAINGANIIVNISASNEVLGKCEYRRELVKQQSARCNSIYVYVSAGPNESSTDVVYSGHAIIAENGVIIAESERFNFESQIVYADVDVQKMNYERIRNSSFSFSKPVFVATTKNLQYDSNLKNKNDIKYFSISKTPFIPYDVEKRNLICEEIFKIQSTALAKRLKHTKISKTILPLSGGLDSTLALLVNIKTFQMLKLPLSDIYTIGMPGPASTDRTQNNAKYLAKLTDVSFESINICNAVEQHLLDIKYNYDKPTVAFENAQARERTQIAFDKANDIGAMVLGTGDLSEMALGWCTYGGDHLSMYHINCGVPKTLVRYVIDYVAKHQYHDEVQKILLDICDTPISPELLIPNKDGTISQCTEDNVGPYILNDFFLYYIIRYHFTPQKVLFLANKTFENNFHEKEVCQWLVKFYKRFFAAQFKRSAVPDGPKIGSVALSPRGDWRMPSDASVESWIKELRDIEEMKI